jgi:hypothetical protein
VVRVYAARIEDLARNFSAHPWFLRGRSITVT